MASGEGLGLSGGEELKDEAGDEEDQMAGLAQTKENGDKVGRTLGLCWAWILDAKTLRPYLSAQGTPGWARDSGVTFDLQACLTQTPDPSGTGQGGGDDDDDDDDNWSFECPGRRAAKGGRSRGSQPRPPFRRAGPRHQRTCVTYTRVHSR